MTNKTFRTLLKAIAAFAITAAFGSASFAGDFTVAKESDTAPPSPSIRSSS